MRFLRQLARAERHGSRKLTGRELTSIAALRRRNLDQIQTAIDFLREGVGGLSRVGVDTAGRRHKEHQRERRPTDR